MAPKAKQSGRGGAKPTNINKSKAAGEATTTTRTRNEKRLEKEGVTVAPPARPLANAFVPESTGPAPPLRRSARSNPTSNVFQSEPMQKTRTRVAEDEDEDEDENEKGETQEEPGQEEVNESNEEADLDTAKGGNDDNDDEAMNPAPDLPDNALKRPRSRSESSSEDSTEEQIIPMDGASREQGGFARGRSRGNAYKGDGPLYPDLEEVDHTYLDSNLPVEGKVYFRPDRNSTTDMMSIPHP